MRFSNLAHHQAPPWHSRLDEAVPLEYEMTTRPDGAALLFIHYTSDPAQGVPVMGRVEGAYFLVFADKIFRADNIDESMAYVRSPQIVVAELDRDNELSRTYSVKAP